MLIELPLALFVVFAITPLNIYCETMKWRVLMGLRNLPFSLALKQVMMGLCAGFVTPNRIGDFAGRLYKMPQPLIGKGGAMALTGSVIQSSITLIFGFVALFIYPLIPFSLSRASAGWQWIIAAAIMGLIICLAASKFPSIRKRIAGALIQLKSANRLTLIHAFKWGFLRYLVFAFQFVILLKFFGCELGIKDCFFGVSLLYFCQSFVPGVAFGELGVRETLSIAIFGAFMPGALLPALAALIIWLANIVIPAAASSLVFGYSRRINA
jgi:uncharacterized membrane protein YbhN (UPF0104 family)